MADRKKARIKSVTDLEKKLEKNSTDKILKNTLERVQMNNEKEEMKDKKIQQVVGVIQKGLGGQFAFGTGLDGVDPTVPIVDPTVVETGAGTTMGEGMPEKFQNKYVHHAPVTPLNEGDEYYRTFSDIMKNIFSTEQQRFDSNGKLVTVVFANGGTVGEDGVTTNPDGTPIVDPTIPPTGPIEVYPGHPEYENYLKYKAANDTYTQYNNFATSFGDVKPTVLTEEQYRKQYAQPDYKLPAGSTGVAIYKTGNAAQYGDTAGLPNGGQPLEGVMAHVPSVSKGDMFTAVPQYSQPEGNYTEIADPKIAEEEKRTAAWNEETKGIQGYVRNVYSEQQEDGTWINKTEEIPLPVGQDIPTNGVFIPKGNMPPPDWLPKEPIPAMANGGTVGGTPPFDIQALLNTLNQLSQAQNLNADSFNMDYANRPLTINPEIPSQGLPPGGIKTNFINADVPDETYGNTGLKLMEETPEDPFVLDPTTYVNNKEAAEGGNKFGDFMNKVSNNPNSQITPGNIMGLVGNAISSFAPLTTTLQNRAGDTTC